MTFNVKMEFEMNNIETQWPDCWVCVKDGKIIGTHDEPCQLDGIEAVLYTRHEHDSEPYAVARVDDLERAGRKRAMLMGLGLDTKLYTRPVREPELLAGWQLIETAPKDGTEVLLFSRGDMAICYWRDDGGMTDWTWGLDQAFSLPTHWMPLPTAPTAQGEKK